MARWALIFWTVFGLHLIQLPGFTDGSGHRHHLLSGRMDRLATSIDRPSSYQLTENDDSGPTRKQAVEKSPEADNRAPPPERKPQADKKRRDRLVPLKPARPSEEIKADQAVDFPYDI